MITAALILAVLVGPLCFAAGVLLGATLQHRAERKLPPPNPLKRRPKTEVTGENTAADEPAPDPRVAAMAEELEKLGKDELQNRAEFYNVPWDDQPNKRAETIQRIVRARFQPGAYRA